MDYGSGLYIKPYLSIELHIESFFLLKKVQSYFSCGRLSIRKDRKICIYEISQFNELWNILIPHFLKYPLFGLKHVAFIRFVQALSLLYPYAGKTKSPLLLGKVIYLMSTLNPINKRSVSEIDNYYNKLGINNKQEREEIIRSINSDFYNSNKFSYYKIFSETSLFNINIFFIIGIIEGDGSFYFSLSASRTR